MLLDAIAERVMKYQTRNIMGRLHKPDFTPSNSRVKKQTGANALTMPLKKI